MTWFEQFVWHTITAETITSCLIAANGGGSISDVGRVSRLFVGPFASVWSVRRKFFGWSSLTEADFKCYLLTTFKLNYFSQAPWRMIRNFLNGPFSAPCLLFLHFCLFVTGEWYFEKIRRLRSQNFGQICLAHFLTYLLSKRAIPGIFHYVRLFNTVDSKKLFNVNFVDDWIWTSDLWCQKQPLCQLCHNHQYDQSWRFFALWATF